MKKTMVYLHDDIHEGLRDLAHEKRVSMAELIRRAVDFAYGEILEDIREAEAELEEYRRDPSTAIPLEEVLAKYSKKSVRTSGKTQRRSRTRATATS